MTDKKLQKVQSRLIELGYSLGPAGADGLPGRFTTAAVTKFQQEHGLDIQYPGTIGPKTLKALALTEDEVKSVSPPWIVEAQKYLGMHEVNNAKVLDKALRLDASEISWCGAFTGLCIATALPKEPLPANQLGARNWLKFGISVQEYKVGSVCVFWRGSRDGWQGHVGFVAGHDKSYIHVLGGNQSDKVTVSKVSKDRLLGMRWPATYPIPSGNLPFTTFNGKVTTNEQ